MKLQLIFVSAFLILVNVYHVSAQDRKHAELKHEKKHKLANNLISKGSYYSAIEHLENLAKQHPKNDKYLLRLADAYYFSRDYKNAEVWYGKVVKMQKKVSSAMYKYAECLKYNAKYVEARDIFKNFAQSKYQDVKGEKYKRLAKNEYLSCEWAISNSGIHESIEVVHLGDHVNSRYSEFAPVIMNDSTLVFSSLQSDTVIKVDSEDPHTFHVKILASTKQNDEWGPHSELPNVNTLYENNANGTFSSDGKRFYFTRCIPDENHKMICSIYMSEIIDGVLQKAVKLDDNINKKGYTSSQPNIGQVIASNKQKYEVLFFTSNRPGGKGGNDIWYSTITTKGVYKAPLNAGSAINTLGDEITPYYHNQTNVLYFSSNFHFGYGRFDFFTSKGTLNQWANPVNIGKPINSSVDDTYYTINSYNRAGFIVSNRPEGYHLTSETCCDDIYSFKVKNPFALNIQAYSKKDTSKTADVKFIVLLKPADSLSIPSFSGNDSLSYLKDSLALAGFTKAMKDTLKVNSLIDNKTFPEIGQSVNNYDLNHSKDYLVYAIGKFDTSVFVFRSSASKHNIENYYSTDSLTNFNIASGKTIDLLALRFYLDADSIKPVIAVKEPAIIEDETSLTVTKFVKEVKEYKTGKFILNYDFNDVNFIQLHAPSLDSLAAVLMEFPDLKISISSHTDDKGTHEYNMELSKKRVKTLEAYLTRKGIDKKRIVSKWYGETEPLVPNSNPDGSDNPGNRHFNRRTEVTILEE